MREEGGIGVIHKNLSVERQAEEVIKVKRSPNGIILNPATLPPDASLRPCPRRDGPVPRLRSAITSPDRRVVGILTRRDLRFQEDLEIPISQDYDQGKFGYRDRDCGA